MVVPNSHSTRGCYLSGIIGCMLISLGTILVIYWPSLFQQFLFQQMQIRLGSKTYNLWKDTPVHQYMNVYFFNWTNPEDVLTSKPILTEMGPYRFTIIEKKTKIVMNKNSTVTYKIKRYWYFDDKNSKGSLDDHVITLNALAKTALHSVRFRNSLIKSSLAFTMSAYGTKVYINRTVGELLFDGYSDELLDVAKTLPSFANVKVPFDRFGWFYQRNGSDIFEGIFNMNTGEKNIYDFGKLHYWNYDRHSHFFQGTCGLVNGSAGELFPPGQTKERPLEMFSADLCRSIKLTYRDNVMVHGVNGFRYIGNEYSFDNGSHDASNSCFCDGECSPSGVLNVTTCRYGAPGFISFPHFTYADPYYANSVKGLKSDPKLHELYIALEPETGIPLDVAARFQINILLSADDSSSTFKDMPTIYFPMLWFEQRASITKGLATELSIALLMPTLGSYVAIGLIIGGMLIIIYIFQSSYRLSRAARMKEDRGVNFMPLLANKTNERIIMTPVETENQKTHL